MRAGEIVCPLKGAEKMKAEGNQAACVVRVIFSALLLLLANVYDRIEFLHLTDGGRLDLRYYSIPEDFFALKYWVYVVPLLAAFALFVRRIAPDVKLLLCDVAWMFGVLWMFCIIGCWEIQKIPSW